MDAKTDHKGRLKNIVNIANTETGKKLKKTLLSGRPGKIARAKQIIDDKIEDSFNHVLLQIPGKYRDLIHLEIPQNQLFISHKFITEAINHFAARYADTVEIIEFTPEDDCYFCRARIDSKVIALRFKIEQVIIESGKATAIMETPKGIAIENNTLLNFFAKSFVALFGGTSFGEFVLSSKLPSTVTWDGRKAKFAFDIPKEKTWQWVHKTIAAIKVEHEAKGLLLAFSAQETYHLILSLIVEWLIKLYCDLRSGKAV